MKRRDFVHTAVLAGAGSGVATGAKAEAAATTVPPGQGRVGPKEVVRGKKAVAASQHPIVTDTMLDVLREGGNAVDAGVAGCLVQATVQQEMTNHTGTVDFIFWEAKSGKAYELNSSGTLVSGLAPVSAVAPESRRAHSRAAALRLHPRLHARPQGDPRALRHRSPGRASSSRRSAGPRRATSSRPSSSACSPRSCAATSTSPPAASSSPPAASCPRSATAFVTPSSPRRSGAWPRKGPTTSSPGEWARQFVAEANRLGWPIKLEHLNEVPPRWGEPLRFKHRDHEILQLAPPERQGVFCAMVLGILRHLDLPALGHYAKSAESLYYFAHALRWAEFELGYLWDPKMFEVPTDLWLSRRPPPLRRGAPQAEQAEGRPDRAREGHLGQTGDGGRGTGDGRSRQAAHLQGELRAVDRRRPGQLGADDEHPAVGRNPGRGGGRRAHGRAATPRPTCARPSRDGSRAAAGMRLPIGNTIVLKDGKPWLSLGTPGNVHVTIPQVLSNILDFGMEPHDAAAAPAPACRFATTTRWRSRAGSRPKWWRASRAWASP